MREKKGSEEGRVIYPILKVINFQLLLDRGDLKNSSLELVLIASTPNPLKQGKIPAIYTITGLKQCLSLLKLKSG